MLQGGIKAKITDYGTLTVHSVVVIPKLKDYRAYIPQEAKSHNSRKTEEKKDFETIFRQAMR